MTKKQDLGGKLEKLALAVVDQALGEGVEIDTRLEALKVAGGFHISASKIKLKLADDDPETPNFGNFKARINGATKGALNG